MSRFRVRRWTLVLPLAAMAAAMSLLASGAFAAPSNEVRVAIMTDCKGAFGGGYELDIGGAQAAFAQYAGGKPKNKAKIIAAHYRLQRKFAQYEARLAASKRGAK